ncbi:PRC-barrel domain containing protein [Candidatus Bathyarchaeota archaeon]|nr:MAG: PRC-barrel domain containing protein [Candidatus Bathyarchaeota archaeon]
MSIQVEAVRRFIGKPAKDLYGRYIGYVVGITLDSEGRLHSVGVDRGGGLFEEFSRSQIMVEGDTLILIPNWKIEAENFKKEYGLTHSRFQALDELLRNNEIPEYVYEELCKEYKNSISKLEENQKNLIETLKGKIDEIDKHVKHLEKFLGHLKVQHKTGEIGDETYKIASEYLISGIEKALKEKEDIQQFLKYLETPEIPHHPPSTTEQFKPSEEEVEKPIIVRLKPE